MILEEIEFDKKERDSVRQAIWGLVGCQAIIEDDEIGPVHVFIPKTLDKKDEVCYPVEIQDSRHGYRNELYYHDVKRLVRLRDNESYPLPPLVEIGDRHGRSVFFS